MTQLKVSENKECFENFGGSKFFYLADTVWSAFTSISMDEWGEYLDYRNLQGFNVLQINILPQWDRSFPDLGFRPFPAGQSGKTDFFTYDRVYFERARKMCEMAVERGMVPALVVLWLDFVPETWGSQNIPDHIMPYDAVVPYVKHVLKVFGDLNPIYLISGDTDFQTETSSKYYYTALETIKTEYPEALTTLHTMGGLVDLPQQFLESGYLDFYMYQSSHSLEGQPQAYTMAENYSAKPVKRPVVNGEPCYEGHGHFGKYGRFDAFTVRKATWQSLLAGAKAGVAYGAHGIWSWHRKGGSFGSAEWSKDPYDWRTALALPGAWDVTFTKHVFELYDLYDINPYSGVAGESKEIRAACSKNGDRVAVYIPFNIEVTLENEFDGLVWTLIDLESRRFAKPEIVVGNHQTILKMHNFNSDVLVIGVKGGSK